MNPMANDKPNLLIIHTDQQSWWTLGCYAGTIVDTPNIDRLAADGALYSNFFANSGVCTPSRGCFMTGRYPHSNGAYTNNIVLNRDEITFAEVLRRNGYRTGYAGKWHLDGTPRPGWVHPDRAMGFEDCRFMFNRGHWKKVVDSPMRDVQPFVFPYSVIGDKDSYTTDWLTTKAIEYIVSVKTAPFCYMLSIPDPHFPVQVRPPYNTMFAPAEMPIPNTFNDENLPGWARTLQSKGPFSMENPGREDQLRQFLALYFGEVKLIDDSVGRILEALAAHEMLENTIVVFTTDHGEYAGEHGLLGKNHLFETAYRIPLLIHWPAGVASGTRVDNVMSTVDFQSTILSLMGVSSCGREQGRNGAALLKGHDSDWDDSAFIYHNTHEYAGIFTPHYELVLAKEDDSILFDRQTDPDQTRNLFENPDYREISESLACRVIQHNIDVGSPAAEWLSHIESA